MSLPPGWGGVDSSGQSSELATCLNGAVGTWVRTETAGEAARRVSAHLRWPPLPAQRWSLPQELKEVPLQEVFSPNSNCIVCSQSRRNRDRKNSFEQWQCRIGYEREGLYSVGHSQGLQPGKRKQKALVPFLNPGLREPGFCMVKPTFLHCHPVSPGFEDPQLVLSNCFNSDFLKWF